MEPPKPSHVVVKASGTALSPTTHRALVSVEIEQTYNRPGLCLLTFSLQPNQDPPPMLDLAKPFTVSMRAGATPKVIFDGEVTAVDFDGAGARRNVVVQGQERSHRLFRGDHTRSFTKKTPIEVVRTMISEAGLSAELQIQGQVEQQEYQLQHNEPNGDFIDRAVGELNCYFLSEGEKLRVSEFGGAGDSGVTLRFGKDLLSFSARATTASFQKKAEVRGWDVVNKAAIVSAPVTGGDARLDSKVTAAVDTMKNGAGTALLVRQGTKNHLTAIAKAAVERSIDANLQADGVCNGNADLAVDKEVTIEGVSPRYNGKYRISRLRHHWSADASFTTEFSCRGGTDQSLAGLVSQAAVAEAGRRVGGENPMVGVAVGLVTDNDDPDGMGRVKVTLPWLYPDTDSSDWLRVALPGAGGNADEARGWYLLPAVDDEVLVAFEHGDPRRGYVLGGLFNGQDKPFYDNGAVLNNGAVNQHAFRMKNGAHLMFDETNGAETLELKSKDDKFIFRFTEAEGVELINQANGDKLQVTNKGAITIVNDTSDITIEAKGGKLNLKAAQDISIESSGGKVAIKAAMDASVEGMNVKVEGQMNTEVKGGMAAKLEGGMNATVKGAMVMIN
jgi:uncharacterized protein involved in type VI secretion and phage assembly